MSSDIVRIANGEVWFWGLKTLYRNDELLPCRIQGNIGKELSPNCAQKLGLLGRQSPIYALYTALGRK